MQYLIDGYKPEPEIKEYLGDLGCETEEREYKVFTFGSYATGRNDGFKLLKSCIFPFDDLIETTIKSYIHTYFPKYFSSFSHPRTSVSSGSFYIGIDDDGLVHGIPYSGELTKEFVLKQIASTADRIRGANDFDCVDKYMELVKVEVFKLDKTNYETKVVECGLQLDFGYVMYKKIKKAMCDEEEKRANYLAKKRRWEKFFNSTPQRIYDIINNRKIRSQLINLIKKTSTSTTKLAPEYKNIYGYCEIKNDYWNMISELKSDKIFNHVTYETAEKIRNDKLSPIYWGLVWRDLKTIPSKLKPEVYRVKHNHKQYSMLSVTQIPKMIPSWIKNNSKMNLFVIKITLPGNISPELFMEYQNSANEWSRSYRTNIDGDPICQPIY
jgi:hypothetical protein